MKDLPERTQTTVQATLELLEGERWWTRRELSSALGVSEKGLPELLEKVARKCRALSDRRLEQQPPRCLSCHFEFDARRRARRPSRCPRCRSERLSAAAHRVSRAA